MLNQRLQIYLAGKVNGDKWKFAKDYQLHIIADYFSSDAMDTIEGKHWCHTPPADRGLDWVGESGSGEPWHPVMEYIINQLHACDLLLAYLDTSDAYGTIAEIAYVSALGKPCVVVFTAPIEGERWYDPTLFADAGDISDSEFQQILEDQKKYCPATDAYWLVSCFPNVYTFREESTFNLKGAILSSLKEHRERKNSHKNPQYSLFEK